MHEITLVLPDDLYAKLQAKAANKGMSLEGLIMEQLSAEATPVRQRDMEKRFLHEVLLSTGLLQSVSLDLIAAYVPDPSAPRRSPVQVQGKPLSVAIIEQRGTLR
jgi:hypothetical protein